MSKNNEKEPNMVGIDLGTSNLLIYVSGRGTVFNEPSIIAVDKETQNVVSVGHKAADLFGKEHAKVQVIRPLSGGVIADIDMIKKILTHTLKESLVSSIDTVDKILICTPAEITETEKQAIYDLGQALGIDNVVIDDEIKAAAVGSGLDIYEPNGKFVVDIGGGTTDFGVLSLGEVVLSRSTKVAGEYFDKQIVEYLKETHQLEIGFPTAQRIKQTLATIQGEYPKDEDGNEIDYQVTGRHLVKGLPAQVTVTAKEIREVILRCFESIRSTLIATLEATPPELSGDLVDNGLLVSGGGALIPGVKEFFEEATGVPVHISKSPLTAVIDGTKKLVKLDRQHYYGEVHLGVKGK